MSTRLYELSFDIGVDAWSLGDPEPGIDSWPFRRGERVEPGGVLQFPVKSAGRPVDITVTGGYIVVVSERVGSVIEALAPNDVQRIPARVDGSAERYELLHVLARIDCVDWEHTRARARVEGNPHSETGTLASLGPLIERDKLSSHVMSDDMTLKTEGIEGPRIFRVIDWELFPVVTDEIKAALENEGATGLEFRPVLTSPRAPMTESHQRSADLVRTDTMPDDGDDVARFDAESWSEDVGGLARPGSERWHEVLDAHSEYFLGHSRHALGEIVPTSEFTISLCPHRASPERPWLTLRTAGVSDYPMHVPRGREDQRYCELLTYLQPDWDLEGSDRGWWPGALLKLLGQFVHEQSTWYEEGHTVLVADPGETYAEGTLVTTALLRAPAVEEELFDKLVIDGTPCRFLWAFPITEAETNLKLEQGPEALLELIEAHELSHVLDPGRPCLVTGRRP